MSAQADKSRVLQLLYDICSKPYDHMKEEYRYQKIAAICKHIEAGSTQYVRMILDDLENAGFVRGRINKNRSKSLYQITSKGYDFQNLVGGDTPIDSTLWTGLAKDGVLAADASERLRKSLRVVERALDESSATNEERAQARAYIIAISALNDAPQPPADNIRKLIYDAAALAGIGALFITLIALYK